jgi:hypothetical protein
MSSGGGEIVLGAVSPGNGFVIGAVVDETTVENADQAVSEGSEGGMMSIASGPVGVVEGAGAW